MIVVTGAAIAHPETFERLRDEAFAHVARSRREDGCISHAVYFDPENALRLVFVEEWRDEAALAAHFAQADSIAFVREVRRLAAGATKMRLFRAEEIGAADLAK